MKPILSSGRASVSDCCDLFHSCSQQHPVKLWRAAWLTLCNLRVCTETNCNPPKSLYWHDQLDSLVYRPARLHVFSLLGKFRFFLLYACSKRTKTCALFFIHVAKGAWVYAFAFCLCCCEHLTKKQNTQSPNIRAWKSAWLKALKRKKQWGGKKMIRHQ